MTKISPETALKSAEDSYELVDSHLRPVADWFHEREGELFDRRKVLADLSDDFGISEDDANRVISNLVGDRVDPVVQVDDGDTLWVGVIRYEEHDFYYEYDDYHPAYKKRPKLVCAQCVHEAEFDHEVAFAAPGEGSLSPDATVEMAEERMRSHFNESHPAVSVDEVNTGASLVSPTTIGGNEAIHKGNMSTEADADTVDALHAADLAPSHNDGSVNAYITSLERFGAEGSSTTSTSYVTIAGSDLTFDPDEYKDSAGNLYVRLKVHAKHSTDSGDVFVRIFRQNAGTAVTGSEVQQTLNDSWGIGDSGWIDFGSETGAESYQLQLKSSDGNSVRYNSVLLFFGVPV